MKFVFDASPLIHLTRAGLASMIEVLDGEKYTVPVVYHEVVDVGKALGYADAVATEELINRRIVKIRNPESSMIQTISAAHKDLHIGEAQVIALSREIKAIAILDDGVARAVAKMHNVRVEGTYSIILRALVKGAISKGKAEDSLQNLVLSGWRCDIELYNKLMKMVRETP